MPDENFGPSRSVRFSIEASHCIDVISAYLSGFPLFHTSLR